MWLMLTLMLLIWLFGIVKIRWVVFVALSLILLHAPRHVPAGMQVLTDLCVPVRPY